MASPFFKGFNETNFPRMLLKYIVFSNVSESPVRFKGCPKIKQSKNFSLISTQPKARTTRPSIINGSCNSEKVVHIMSYGPPFDQSNYGKANPYHLPYDKNRYRPYHLSRLYHCTLRRYFICPCLPRPLCTCSKHCAFRELFYFHRGLQ